MHVTLVSCVLFLWLPTVVLMLLLLMFLFTSLYLILGVLYIIVSLAVRIYHASVFELFDQDIPVSWPNGGPQ